MLTNRKVASILSLVAGVALAACSSSTGGGGGTDGGLGGTTGATGGTSGGLGGTSGGLGGTSGGLGGTSGGLGGTSGGLGGTSGGLGGTSGGDGGTSGGLGGTSGGDGGTSGGLGGTSGGDGGTSGGLGGTSGNPACDPPQCLIDFANSLGSGCAAMGACVTQTTQAGTSSTSNTCYANGVKVRGVTAFDLASGSGSIKITIIKSDGATTCASFEAMIMGTMSPPFLLKDGAGNTVVTVTSNADMSTTYACASGGSKTIPSSCKGMPSMAPMMPNTQSCTKGTCM